MYALLPWLTKSAHSNCPAQPIRQPICHIIPSLLLALFEPVLIGCVHYSCNPNTKVN